MSASPSKEEIELYRKVFSSFDLDRNGKISVDELELVLCALGMNKRQLSIIHMIEDVDMDNDQELNFDEFLNLIQSKHFARLFEEGENQDLQQHQSFPGLQNIYGQTPTPPETEKCVKSGLEQLQVGLNTIRDKQKQKKRFIRALKKCPHLINGIFFTHVPSMCSFPCWGMTSLCSIYNIYTFVLSTSVCARCLSFHCSFASFRPKRAARRLVNYWDKRIELFGKNKSFTCLTLDEVLADESVALSLGYIIPTGQNDTCGRGILFMDYSREGKAEYLSLSLVRAVWYMFHLVLEDEDTQKQGVVVINKCCDSLLQWNVKTSKILASHAQGALPIRLAGLHVPHPPIFIKILLKTTRLLLGKNLQNRIREHNGSQEEVIDLMSTYGIPKSAIWDVWGGEFNLNGQEWLEGQRFTKTCRK